MSDKELMEELRKFGENPGPITDTTRGVYQRKLAKHLAEKTKGESVIKMCGTFSTVRSGGAIDIECILVSWRGIILLLTTHEKEVLNSNKP